MSVIRVFVDPMGNAGNLLGVFADARGIASNQRQAIARELNFSETVFVLSPHRGIVKIFTPATELPFAGHPLVGTAWLLRQRQPDLTMLRPPAGDVSTWSERSTTWIRARPEWAPAIDFQRHESFEEIETLSPDSVSEGFVYAWAWLDEPRGHVRARGFAPELGVPEDEATGAAVVRLTAILGRPLLVRQGRGSVIRSEPGPGGTIDIGGSVAHEADRVYEVD